MAAPRILAILTLASSLVAGPVSAEIYKWADASGAIHFTDRLDNVPAATRTAVEQVRQLSRNTQKLQFSQRSSSSARVPSLSSSPMKAVVPIQREGTLMKVDVRLNDDLVEPFYIDTGATSVVIPERIARALGLNIGATAPREWALTPGGLAQMKVVHLSSLDVNGAKVHDLETLVSSHLDVGLLGGAFLRHFNYSVDTEAGTILLEPIQARAGR